MPTSTEAPVSIIDGAVPRHPRERCRKLLDYAEALFHLTRTSKTGHSSGLKLDALKQEVSEREEHPDVTFLYWDEVEDDIIEFISDILPDELRVVVGRQTPGDVIVVKSEDFSEGDTVTFSVEVPRTIVERVNKTGEITHIMADGTLVVKVDDGKPGHYLVSETRATRSE